MKKAYLFVCFSSILFTCQKDELKASEMLLSSWTRFYAASDASFNVKLTFNKAGTFSWELMQNVPTHSNSYAQFSATENEITISNDPECPEAGLYTYSIKGNQLTITLVSDGCSQRSPAFSGVWEKF